MAERNRAADGERRGGSGDRLAGAGAVKKTRRAFLAGLASVPALAQGISSRGVKPAARGKASGIPFPCRVVDVAREAGLTKPVIYGPDGHKDYIIEVTGCGVA